MIVQNYNILDTSVYVPTKSYGEDVKLKKRARSKIWTQAINLKLMKLDSVNARMYQRAYYCCDGIVQEGTTLKAKYCNSRSCNICNRIRTAKLMEGYIPQMKGIHQFVTLTIPNVKANELREAIQKMIKTSGNIIRTLRERQGLNPNGIRKIEVTYNSKRKDYHPHLHILIDCEESAHQLIIRWLDKYPLAKIEAQDIREGDQDSFNELFKYTTKIGERVSGKQELEINIKALDTILVATRNLRVFQPFGNIRKKSEEITAKDLTKQEYKVPYKENASFLWMGHDWRDINTGQFLTYTERPTFKIIDTSEYDPPPKKLSFNTTKVLMDTRLNLLKHGNEMQQLWN
jgi:hypothetical protein